MERDLDAVVLGQAGGRAADRDEARLVVLHVVDALGEDGQAVPLGGLARADGRKAHVALVAHVLRSDSRVRGLDGGEAVRGNEGGALRQGMGMRADAPDVRHGRARNGREAVGDLFDVRAVDGQVVVEQQVIDRADRAGGRIFDRNDADIRLAVAHRLKDLLPGRDVDRLALREERAGGKLLICARDALIEHGFRLQHLARRVERELFRAQTQDLAVLILAARADHALEQGDVLEADFLLHAGGALFDDLGLAVGLVDLVVRLRLGLCDLVGERHTQQEQLADSGVDRVDVLADGCKLTHSRSPPSEDPPERLHTRPR